MSIGYIPVQWNKNKYIYDAILLIAVIAYIVLFMKFAPNLLSFEKPINTQILRMRAFGTCAFWMLTFILCIGPLTRLDPRFLPLLYNRRHFGVLLLLVVLSHAEAVLNWYHSFSRIDPWVAVLSSNSNYDSFIGFPFEFLGILALLIVLLMAVTSHDFWLEFLSPTVWKYLHMGIYVAYGLVIMHVTLGLLQTEDHFVYIFMVLLSLGLVTTLHLTAGLKEWRKERKTAVRSEVQEDGIPWVIAGTISEILEVPVNRALIVSLERGERVAIFRHQNKLSAVSNVCAHQNGPLGEGCIIDGYITCPWHGFQYNPENGRSSPPFTQKIQTYQLRKNGDTILLNPLPFPSGTYVEPVMIDFEEV